MSLTQNQFVDTIGLELNGFAQTVEQASHLVTGVTSSALSLTVGDGATFSRGIIEIDDELIYVSSVDQASNVLTVAPYGRGYAGTTAASHLANVKITNSPQFPKAVLRLRVNEAIDAVYPTLYAQGSTTFLMVNGTTGYAMPAAATDVLYVSWRDNITLEYVPVRRWKFDPRLDQITIYDGVPQGRTVSVYYRSKPGRLVNGTDLFSTVTGLPESCEDVIRLSVLSRILPFLEAQNSSSLSAEADFAANSRISSTSASALSRMLYQQYLARLTEEGTTLAQLNPVRVHYSN